MKKLIAFLLAMIMVFSMATVAFAADGDDTAAPVIPTVPVDEATTNNQQNVRNGSITINGVSDENHYALYKMLHLSGYDTEDGAYSYLIVDEWFDFFTSPEEAAHIKIENGYVTWQGGDDPDTVAAFAKRALAYAEKEGIAPVKASHDEEGNITGQMNTEKIEDAGVFEGLTMGWYLVDSTMGALCGLTTTNPNASINAKNAAPSIDKQVEEDSTSQYGDKNTADIGQDVNFRTTINVHAGAQNFVLHDIMSAGLTFKGVTKVEHIVPPNDTHVVEAGKYTVVTEGLTDGCAFHVVFTPEFCDELEDNDKVIVYYTAMLNRNAIVAGEGNSNTAKLEFGEDHFTTGDTTYTKTFGFDLVKTDSQNTLLDGAKFRIYDAETGGNEIGVVVLTTDDDGNVTVYRRARPDEQEEGETVDILVKDGKVRVVGLDNGTYYLEETVPPNGYNALTSRQKFIISDANLDATFNDGIFSSGSGVHVVNKTGSMLPETGAMGTTMFITFGMFTVLAAGVLLVTKKRMSMIQE